MRCWEETGCRGIMASGCPHDATGYCPRICSNTMVCDNPQHERALAMEMLEAFDVDFKAARKEACHNCRFFLQHAPKIALFESGE